MDKIRVGVIGVGSMGKNHARVYSQIPNVELIGVSDIDKKTAEKVAAQYNTHAFTDYKKLLKQDVDAVSIAVPIKLHKKVALDVMDKGVHIMLEKPIAESIESSKKIVQKSDEKNVKLMIGHIERFNPIIPVIKKAIENTRVISINITRVGPLPPKIKDVGVVIDIGVHDIDLLRYITGSEFKRVYSLTMSSISEKEDVGMLSFVMTNGVLAHITTDWLTPYKVREIKISTKEKFITGNFITQKVTEYGSWENSSYIVRDLFVPFEEPLMLELQSFIKSIREDLPVAITGTDGLKALEVALKCIRTTH